MKGFNMTERFKVVFDEIAKIAKIDESGRELIVEVHKLKEEIDEIEELRRLAFDIADPDPMSYTAT